MIKGVKEVCLLEAGESTHFTVVRHLCVSGSNELIGRRLAEYAKANYGIDQLGKYENQEYGRMRRNYFKRNWPQMAARMRGVERAFDTHLKEEDRDFYDSSALVYDVPASAQPVRPSCSAVYIPKECSSTRSPIVARNYDAWRIEAKDVFTGGSAGQTLYARPFVLELQPRGHKKIIALGGHDLLCPFQDALNDKGLFITSLADDARPLEPVMTMAGGRNTGLGSRQLLLMLAENCRSVREAKEAARALVVRKDIGLHWLIADADGDATVLGIDRHGCVFFTDTPKDRPLLVTNHPLHPAGQGEAWKGAENARKSHCNYIRGNKDCSYPQCMTGGANGTCSKYQWDFAYDTFKRMDVLKDAVAVEQRPFSPEFATALMNKVACAFACDDLAGVRRDRRTRTAWSVTTELRPEDQELTVRFYVDDGDPEMPGSNHLNIKSAAYSVKFGFRRQMLWKDKPNPISAAQSTAASADTTTAESPSPSPPP